MNLFYKSQKQNVSILSTHDDNRWHVTIPLFDLISQYMSFSYVTRPLPVKWHFRSKRHISHFVDMTFPYTHKETERFYLVAKMRKRVSSDPTLNSSIVPPALEPPSRTSINRKKMCLINIIIYHF
jgi:hypothetical protein